MNGECDFAILFTMASLLPARPAKEAAKRTSETVNTGLLAVSDIGIG
jgi:hypothetical protein